MGANRLEILEKKVDLLIQGYGKRLLLSEFNSLLKDIEKLAEIKEKVEKPIKNNE